MQERVIKNLAELIIADLKNDMYFSDIENVLNSFLDNNNIEIKEKEHVIELLYLYKVYKKGYISPDPRYTAKKVHEVKNILETKNSKELNEKLKEVEEFVNMLKEAESNPMETAKRRIADEEEFKGVIF